MCKKMVRKTSNRIIFLLQKGLLDEGVTFGAGLKLETGCWLWCLQWFWSQLRDADGQITFSKRTETRRDQNAVFRHRRRKIISNNCTQGYCKLLTTLTVCSYIQQSFAVTSTSLWLPEVPTTTAAFYVITVISPPSHLYYSVAFQGILPFQSSADRKRSSWPIIGKTRGDLLPPLYPLTHRHLHTGHSYSSFLLSNAQALLSSDSYFFTAKKWKFTLATTSNTVFWWKK